MFYNLFLHIKCNNGLVFNGIKTSLLYSVSASSTLSTTMTNNNRLIAFAIRSAMTRKLIQFYCATFCVGGCSRNFNLNFISAPSELTQTQSATQSWPTWPNWTESTAASQVNLCVLHIACVTKSRTTQSSAEIRLHVRHEARYLPGTRIPYQVYHHSRRYLLAGKLNSAGSN